MSGAGASCGGCVPDDDDAFGATDDIAFFGTGATWIVIGRVVSCCPATRTVAGPMVNAPFLRALSTYTCCSTMCTDWRPLIIENCIWSLVPACSRSKSVTAGAR